MIIVILTAIMKLIKQTTMATKTMMAMILVGGTTKTSTLLMTTKTRTKMLTTKSCLMTSKSKATVITRKIRKTLITTKIRAIMIIKPKTTC